MGWGHITFFSQKNVFNFRAWLKSRSYRLVLHNFSFLISIRYLLFQIRFSDIIGLAQITQEYHQRLLRTDKHFNILHKFPQNVLHYLKNKPTFGDLVIWYRFSMLFNAGLSIAPNRFWVQFWCRFDILKYRAALL